MAGRSETHACLTAGLGLCSPRRAAAYGFLDTDGAFGTAPVALPSIEDGQWHSVSVSWNAALQSLSHTFDGQSMGTRNADVGNSYLGGTDFAYFGVGAGTGSLASDHAVRFTSIDATPWLT